MELTRIIGAVLLAVALLFALPALDRNNFKPFGDSRRFNPRRLFTLGPDARMVWRVVFRNLMVSELGAVTVTYYVRGGTTTIDGSTTGPTGAQASQVHKQAAKIAFGATADAQALFTHNMGLDASAPEYYEPEILWEILSTNTYCPLITFDRTNTNVLKVNKPATDAACTVLVTIRRPHSLGQ
jgi:hypothetical protein